LEWWLELHPFSCHGPVVIQCVEDNSIKITAAKLSSFYPWVMPVLQDFIIWVLHQITVIELLFVLVHRSSGETLKE
jgi:hypothetical protein